MSDLLTVEEHDRLVEEGWRFRFTGEEPRVSELKEFYEDMGLETLVKTGALDDGTECRSCMTAQGFEDNYKTVYTRGIAGNLNRKDDDLF